MIEDKFGRKWMVDVRKHDPVPNSTKRFMKVTAESTGRHALEFSFFAAFESAGNAEAKAKEMSDLIPYT